MIIENALLPDAPKDQRNGKKTLSLLPRMRLELGRREILEKF